MKQVVRIIVQQQQQQQTPGGQNQIAQQQRTRHQYKVQTPGNCVKFAAKEFVTFWKI